MRIQPIFIVTALSAAFFATASTPAQTTAGRITWLPLPFAVKDANDVNKSGELCIAANLGPEVCETVINGVHFQADRAHWTKKILIRGGPIVRSQMYWPDLKSGGYTLKMPFNRAAGMGAPTPTEPEYKAGLGHGRHKSPAYPSTTVCSIEGLTPGNNYLIQIWFAQSRTRTTEWDDGQGGREGKGGMFLTANNTAKGQYAIGNFTAAANGIQTFTNYQQHLNTSTTPPLKETHGSCNMIQIRDVTAKPGAARATYYGMGTPGTNKQPFLGGSKCSPAIRLSGHPKMGTSIILSAENSQDTASNAMLLLGLPVNVAFLSGVLLVNPLLSVPLPMPAPATPYVHTHELQLPLTVPNSAGTIYVQVLQRDSGAKEGVSFTPGIKIDIGT
jgi:hypothetical protein